MKKGTLRYLGRKLSKVDLPTKSKSATKPIDKNAYNVGVGYVIIPSDVDRNLFVKKCLSVGRVGIINEYGGIEWDCLIDKGLLNTIDFPTLSMDYGSMIAYVRVPNHNDPLIVANLSKMNENLNYSESSFFFERALSDCEVSLRGDALNGTLDIILTGRGSKIPKINVSVNNIKNKGEFNLNIDGNFKLSALDNVNLESVNETNIKSEKKVSFLVKKIINGEEVISELKYVSEEGYSYKDEFENEEVRNKDRHQIKPKEKFDIGEGSEPLVLGNSLKGILDELISAIGKITVPTALGPSGVPVNKAEFEAIRKKLDTTLSKYANTD